MATINNVLVTTTFTLTDGSTVTVADAQGERYGTAAIEAFKAGKKVIPAFTAETQCWLNFYTIAKACIETAPSTEEFEDPNCTSSDSE